MENGIALIYRLTCHGLRVSASRRAISGIQNQGGGYRGGAGRSSRIDIWGCFLNSRAF